MWIDKFIFENDKLCPDHNNILATNFPVVGILAFRTPGFGSYSMRATASYSYEGLVAVVIL